MVWDENLLLGQIFYERMKLESKAIAQIDAGTGESETYKSVLDRSVRLALCMRKLGLKPRDIMAFSGKNHLDVHIPYYAALMNGLPITGVDPNFKYDEIKEALQVTSPKIVFCDPEQYKDFVKALHNLGINAKVFKYGNGKFSMGELIDSWTDELAVKNYEPAVFGNDAFCWLVSTGGTTGAFKLAAFTHKTVVNRINNVVRVFNKGLEAKTERRIEINMSPVQWTSGFILALTPLLLHDTKLQTSAPLTPEHAIDILNEYKPDAPMLPPSMVAGILKSKKPCDFAGVKSILLSGSKIHTDVLEGLKKRLPKGAFPLEAYGQTENLGPVLLPNPLGPLGACGKPNPYEPVKLVDPETGKEVKEPNKTGELWTKCSSCMTEYYNNPEETANAFEDGWYKTGDLMYRDEDNNYFFVERAKLLIKYRNYDIVPTELEAVIRTHPGVYDVSVTSVPHVMDGEHPVACVVRAPASKVTEDEICKLVGDKLSENKKLRGGVLFMDELPYTSTKKLARGKLKQIVLEKLKDNIKA